MRSDLNIRDEEKFLIGLCRLSFNDELILQLKTMAEKITGWKYFASLAGKHGVAALVYSNLEKLNFLQYIPSDISGNLRSSFMMNIARNTRFTEAAAKVLRILNRQNIKTVLLKGLALELYVYGNSGLRQMSDMDILLSRENCLWARKILINEGFISYPVKSVFHRPIIAQTGKHLPTLTRNGFPIDMHSELFGIRKSTLTDILYYNSIETEIKSEKTFIPEVQIFFLYLVKHLWYHEMNNESQLRLYTDLVVLIEKYGERIINQDLLSYAGQADLSEILAIRMEPLRDLWGISFPGWFNDFIDNHTNRDSINKFVFFLKSPKDNPVQNREFLYRYNLSEIPGFHRKILFISGDLFPTFRFMKKRYNCESAWGTLLYYPLRFGKLWYIIKGAKDQGSTMQGK